MNVGLLSMKLLPPAIPPKRVQRLNDGLKSGVRLTLVLFWNAFPALVPNRVDAIGVDVATLACLLWLNWPTESAIGY